MNFSPKNIIKHLKLRHKSSATGPDGIPGLFWSSMANSLANPLSITFN